MAVIPLSVESSLNCVTQRRVALTTLHDARISKYFYMYSRNHIFIHMYILLKSQFSGKFQSFTLSFLNLYSIQNIHKYRGMNSIVVTMIVQKLFTLAVKWIYTHSFYFHIYIEPSMFVCSLSKY